MQSQILKWKENLPHQDVKNASPAQLLMLLSLINGKSLKSIQELVKVGLRFESLFDKKQRLIFPESALNPTQRDTAAYAHPLGPLLFAHDFTISPSVVLTHFKILKELSEAGFDFNFRGYKDKPLGEYEHMWLQQYLFGINIILTQGFQVSYPDNPGLKQEFKESLPLFEALGFSVYQRSTKGNTVAHLAITRQNWLVTEALLESYPALLETRDGQEKTVRMCLEKHQKDLSPVLKSILEKEHLDASIPAFSQSLSSPLPKSRI